MKETRLNLSCPIVGYPRGVKWARLVLIFLLAVSRGVHAQPGSELSNSTSYGYLGNFDSSMAIVIAFLVCAFFLMGFFSIYLRRCAESHIAAGGIAGSGAPRSRRGLGLDRTVIETFPILVYSAVKDLKMGKGTLECAVCLSEFEDFDSLRLLPKCNHVFHPECIDVWLASHITCPVCRAKLLPDAGTLAGGSTQILAPSNDVSDLESPGTEISEVVINVNENQTRESQDVEMIIGNQPARTRIAGKLPRSHSTGHSLVQPGECTERYTLRLPEEVRRQLATSGKLRRSCSYDVVLPMVGSCRNGYRSGGEGSKGKSSVDRQTGRFDPWLFSMTPPFISRGTSSVKSPRGDSDREAAGKRR
ncbi:hypothetical protein UlMin_038741 [Ulmus minor]